MSINVDSFFNKDFISRRDFYKKLGDRDLACYINKNKLNRFEAVEGVSLGILSGGACIGLSYALASLVVSSTLGIPLSVFLMKSFVILRFGISGGIILVGLTPFVITNLMKENYLNEQLDKGQVETILQAIDQNMQAHYQKLQDAATQVEAKHQSLYLPNN